MVYFNVIVFFVNGLNLGHLISHRAYRVRREKSKKLCDLPPGRRPYGRSYGPEAAGFARGRVNVYNWAKSKWPKLEPTPIFFTRPFEFGSDLELNYI
jgi:hypothetical protein